MTAPRRLQFSPRAAADLDEIAAYIARDNPVRAASFIAEPESTCRSVAAAPQLHPIRIALAAEIRVAVHGRYLVLYRELKNDDAVRIERVLHGARNIPRLI